MKFLKLFLFTIVLISCTCLRLKFQKKYVSYMVQILDMCCDYNKENYVMKLEELGTFICDPSELIGMYCKCDLNCKYGTCKDGKCAWKQVGEQCSSHVECFPNNYSYCLSGKCYSFK